MFDFEKKGLNPHSDLVWVGIFGALGGFLFWAICILSSADFCKTEYFTSTWLSLPLSVLLGAGSGAVFVFLIASTDRTDKARLLTLAFLSGFFWEPVWIVGERSINAANYEKKSVSQSHKIKEISSSIAKDVKDVKDIAKEDVENQMEEEVESDEIIQLARLVDDLIKELVFPDANEKYSSLGLSHSFRKLESLQPGEQEQDSLNQWQWIKLSINDAQKVTIEITAEDASDDLIARLYHYEEESNRLEPVVYDDDSGGNKNPKLEVELPSGEYLLNVAHFGEEDKPLNFSVTYSSIPYWGKEG